MRSTTMVGHAVACGVLLAAIGVLPPQPAFAASRQASTATPHDSGAQSPTPTTTQQQQAPAAQQPATDGGGHEWSYGGRGALSFFVQDGLQAGLGVSGFAVLSLSTDFEIEGEIGYQAMNMAVDGLPRGRLRMLPLRATLRVQLWRFGGVQPYAGGGGGIYLSRFTLDPDRARDLAEQGLGATADIDPGFGLHAAGGMEWQRGRWHFGFDVKYVWAEADAASIVVDQVTEEILREASILKLDGLWIAAGARFSF